MAQFETGKTYLANVGPHYRENIGPGRVHIEKRTRCYVTISGEFFGRYRVCNAFGHETIVLPTPYGRHHTFFCIANHEEVRDDERSL